MRRWGGGKSLKGLAGGSSAPAPPCAVDDLLPVCAQTPNVSLLQAGTRRRVCLKVYFAGSASVNIRKVSRNWQEMETELIPRLVSLLTFFFTALKVSY